MSYEELVNRIAHVSGRAPLEVRQVLSALPEVLVSMEEGDQVRTPMGVFRQYLRKGRVVNLPGSTTPAEVAETLVVKLKPGSRLRR